MVLLPSVRRAAASPWSRIASFALALQIEEVHNRIRIRRNIMRHVPSLICLKLVAVSEPRPALERDVLRDLSRLLAHIEYRRPLLNLFPEVLRIQHRIRRAMQCLELRSPATVGRVGIAYQRCPLSSCFDDLACRAVIAPDVVPGTGETTKWYTSP